MAAALAPIRAATGGDDATLRTVPQKAADASDDATSLAVFAVAAAPAPLGRPLRDWQKAPMPEPIIWRDPAPTDPPTAVDAVVQAGTVGVLASAGGIGKTTATVEIASAAASATGATGSACGLTVAAGPVWLVSYEDDPATLAYMQRRTNADGMDRLHVWPDPAPLWTADGNQSGTSHECAEWPQL